MSFNLVMELPKTWLRHMDRISRLQSLHSTREMLQKSPTALTFGPLSAPPPTSPISVSLVAHLRKTFSELEYTGKKKQTRRDRFLADLEQLVSWSQLAAQVVPLYGDTTGKRGRPAIELSSMLRMYVVQPCFGFSGEGTEVAVYDSLVIRGFLGIELGRESASDTTTLLRFRRLLENHHQTRVLPGSS